MDTTEELRSVRARVTLRDHQRLRDTLATIDDEGWSGPAAGKLLTFVREDLVRPLVIDVGLRGAASWQAEATGWAAAWECLCAPSLRSVVSPWGVVWTAVRRAVMGEMLAARYCTSVRKAWRLHTDSGLFITAPVLIDVDRLQDDELGRTQEAQQRPYGFGGAAGPVIDALVDAGWDRDVLVELIEMIGFMTESGDGRRADKAGWRPIAVQLGIEHWRVRRLMTLLMGEPGWPGLVERVLQSGSVVLDDVALVAAVQSTVVRWMKTPVYAARIAAAKAVRDAGREAA